MDTSSLHERWDALEAAIAYTTALVEELSSAPLGTVIVDRVERAVSMADAARKLETRLSTLVTRAAVDGKKLIEDHVKEEAAALDLTKTAAARKFRTLFGEYRGSLGLAFHKSPAWVGKHIEWSETLMTSLPHTAQALANGDISPENARALSKEAAMLCRPEHMGELDALIFHELPHRTGESPERWSRLAQRWVAELEPDERRKREFYARQKRHVSFTRRADGMCVMRAEMRAVDAESIRAVLDARTRRLINDPSTRSGLEYEDADVKSGAVPLAEVLAAEEGQLLRKPTEQLRLDLLVATLLGKIPADGSEDHATVYPTRAELGGAIRSSSPSMPPVQVTLNITVSDRSLLSPKDGTPATIEGYGVVDGKTLLEDLAASNVEHDVGLFYRRLYTHPATGELLTQDARRRRFSNAMAEFILSRDVTCRGPFCNARIKETDHIVPYSDGGETSIANAQGLCALCNAYKELFSTAQPANTKKTSTITSTQGTSTPGTSTQETSTQPTPEGLSRRKEASPHGKAALSHGRVEWKGKGKHFDTIAMGPFTCSPEDRDPYPHPHPHQ